MHTRATLAVRLVTLVTRFTRVDIPEKLYEYEYIWSFRDLPVRDPYTFAT